MAKECILCTEKIEEKCGKLKGTMLKVNDENKKNKFIYVCSGCQDTKDWITKAKIKGA